MSTTSTSKGVHRGPDGKPIRLDSLKNPLPRPPLQSKKLSRAQRLANSRECPNEDCTDKDVGEEDGQLICRGCGTVVNDSNMVSEVMFGLSSTGGHIAHGAHVGADQSFARSAMSMRARAAGGMESREVTDANGRRYIHQLGAALTVSQSLMDSGMQIFKLAAANNFIQGRRTRSVAAVCLYIACRIQKDSNRIMLIDFSDVLMLNVFTLGRMYKALIEELRINGNGFTVQPINPEDLILRFCSRLEFGEDTMRVANDAVRLVQRFNRDWMTPGRRPAGICGAAVIIAARMNNFRRTTREVVYIAKVAEATLQKRLDEFKATESSGLTVEEFRTIDLESFCDPPSFYERKDGKKRTRKRKLNEFDDDGSAGDEPRREASTNPSAATGQLETQSDTQQAAQNDSRSMPPPPIPIDPALLRVSAQRLLELQSATASEGNSSNSVTPSPAKKKRGRPSKKPKTAATAAATVAIDDSNPATEIASLIAPPSTFSLASALHRTLGEDLEAPSIPSKPRAPISNSETISEEEFASDIEVKDCLLTPDEAAIKERIWTHENKDYLRAQQNKLIRQQLAEENGTARTIIKRKRRRKRMGDMSAYREEGDEEGRIAKTPAEAAMMMLKNRGFSKKINYETLKALYEPSVPSSTIDSNSNPSRRPSTTQEDSTTPSTPVPVGEDITSSTGNTTKTTVQEAKRDTALDEGDDDEHEEGDPDFWNEDELEEIQAKFGNELDDDDDDDDDGDLAEEEYDGEEYD